MPKEEKSPEIKSKPVAPPTETDDDSVIFGTASDNSDINKAAINAGLNTEIEKINESLLKISLLMNKKENREVKLENEVATNLSKSINLWSSMMMGITERPEN